MTKVKLPTTSKSYIVLINCPRGCTQHRTKSYRLAERKTFSVTNNICFNCGFKKVAKSGVFHGAGFKKASELIRI